ncbi:MAG: adenosylcobinamide-GDP ribazoletransferase, partial [Dehalococcoidia bacterium]
MKPLFDAFTLLTIIPVPFVKNHDSPPSRFAPLFFPIIGLLIGVGAASVFTLVDEFLPRNLASALVVTSIVAITGALHIDGLADFFDGMFGGHDSESRLRIMKQPEVGAFGVSAVVLVLLIDWAALSSITSDDAWIVLPLVGLVSRTAPLMVMATTNYVSANGLGQSYAGLSKSALIVMLVFTLAVAAVIGGGPALSAAIVGLIAAALVGLFARKRIGGANGDVYGASVELVAAVCLIG